MVGFVLVVSSIDFGLMKCRCVKLVEQLLFDQCDPMDLLMILTDLRCYK